MKFDKARPQIVFKSYQIRFETYQMIKNPIFEGILKGKTFLTF